MGLVETRVVETHEKLGKVQEWRRSSRTTRGMRVLSHESTGETAQNALRLSPDSQSQNIAMPVLCATRGRPGKHRASSVIRKRTHLGPYRRPVPGVSGESLGGWAFIYGQGTSALARFVQEERAEVCHSCPSPRGCSCSFFLPDIREKWRLESDSYSERWIMFVPEKSR